MGSWLYGFKFLDGIRFHYCSMGFGEIRFLKCCDVNISNSWLLMTLIGNNFISKKSLQQMYIYKSI